MKQYFHQIPEGAKFCTALNGKKMSKVKVLSVFEKLGKTKVINLKTEEPAFFLKYQEVISLDL